MNVFVGGVHGAGKTFLVQPTCAQLGVRYATASQLIRARRGSENWSPSRFVTDVEGNQQLLVAAISDLSEAGERLVLDGHFVLRKDVEVHQEIDLGTFAQLRIRAILLIEAPSQVVAERLAKRGDQTWTASEIERLALREATHARATARELGVSLRRLNSPTSEEVRESIAQMFGSP